MVLLVQHVFVKQQQNLYYSTKIQTTIPFVGQIDHLNTFGIKYETHTMFIPIISTSIYFAKPALFYFPLQTITHFNSIIASDVTFQD